MAKKVTVLVTLVVLVIIGYSLKQLSSSRLTPQTGPIGSKSTTTGPSIKPQQAQPTKPKPKPSTPQKQPRPKAQASASSPKTPKVMISLPVPSPSGTNVSAADIDQVEKMVVDLVNKDRAKYGLKPVTWDQTAANAASSHVQEEVDNGYISHWGLDGAKPQLRYSRAGGLDAVDENESVTLWLQGGFKGVNKDQLYKLVAQHEVSMLNEQAPNDGHRKNILDSHHTGVGIVIAVGKYGVAMAQEFTNHYAQLNPLPLTAPPGANVTLSGRILPGYQITGIYAVWEQLPQPMSRAQLLATDTYSDPPWSNLHFWARPNGDKYYVATPQGNIFAKDVKVDSNGAFSLVVPLMDSNTLDYITLELAPDNNPNDRFYAGQFVVQH